MVNEDTKYEPIKPIAPNAELIICARCGKEYPSIGKRDTGYCRDCMNDMNAILVGGQYDGMRNSGLLERYE